MEFTDVLSSIGTEFRTEGHHHCKSGWVQFDCPFCSPGWGKYRMGFNTRGGYVNCWVCGPHRLLETIATLAGVTERQAKSLLSGLETLDKYEEKKPTGKLVLPKGLGELLPAHRKYLKGRGFDPDNLTAIWNLGGIGIALKYRWRLFIPVIQDGQTVSWTTRSLTDKGVRYVSAPPDQESVPIKDTVYGLDYVRYTVVVHEGPFDVFRVGPGAVCTFGTSYTKAQILKLARVPYRVVCFDNESEARRRAEKLVADLSGFPGRTFLAEPDGKDIASSSQSCVKTLKKFLRTGSFKNAGQTRCQTESETT